MRIILWLLYSAAISCKTIGKSLHVETLMLVNVAWLSWKELDGGGGEVAKIDEKWMIDDKAQTRNKSRWQAGSNS